MQVQRPARFGDPFSVLARVDREFDELMRSTWRSAPGGAAPATFVPAVEIARDGADVVVHLELPGIDVESDVTLEADRGKLIVSGERRDPRATEQVSAEGGEGESRDASRALLVRELRYGAFRREFGLPPSVTAEQIEATYDAGLLHVRVRDVFAPDPEPVRVPITARAATPSARMVEGETA